ncbi:type II secretion system F family protein [Ruminococcaceae bacterium OttesenSCG-928-L11]|nr:type II secretion system F family protein [Ruminococcaceae bacterium OttesenSCG-928-L11]
MEATGAGRGSGAKKDMLTNSEISAFCAQIAMIMKSGIPISEGVSIMIEDQKNPQGRQMLEQIGEFLDTGGAFYAALEHTGKFPQYVIDMTEMGEKTGKLDNVMDSLYTYYEREEAISKNIRSAVAYPMVMIVMMLMVIIVLIVKVLPIFNDVFIQLGSEMSGFSRGMMEMGQVLSRYSVVFIGILFVVVLLILLARYTKKGQEVYQSFKQNFFATRKLMDKMASGRFASAMAMMLSSGLDIDQSLDMAHKLVANSKTREKIDKCKDLMKDGESFSSAIVNADIFSGVYARMISVGFKTGSVDNVMNKIADMYDDEIQSRVENTIAVLEPTLVAVLSIIMGMILLSVMMPLMGIMTSIG